MANTIKLKRASGSDPSASDLSVGELAIRTSNCKLFSKNDGGSAIGIVAGSADTLTTARTIAGVSFDGSANISLNNNAITNGAGYLADIVSDTSPQLGGDLDVQSSKITTATSNGNVKIEPDGTGVVEIRGAGGNDGKLQLNCSAQSHGIKLASPAHSAGQSYTLIFPDNQIAADKYLKIKSISGSGSTAIGQAEYASLDANDLGEGTVPDARFPSTLPALNGSALTNLNGSNIASGTVAAARVATLNQDTTGTAAIATTITVADESSDTSCNVLFATAATGNLAPKSGTNLTFNSSSGVLTATGFAGALTGNVTGNASGSSGSCTGNAATATALETARTIAGVSFDGTANISLNNNAITNGAGYITSTLTNEEVQDIVGGMVTGNTETGITVTYQDGDGTLDFVVGTLNQDTTGTAAIATTVTVADESSDTTCFPLFATAATGDLAPKSGSNLTFNSSNGTLTATAFAGDGSALTGISAGATGGGSDEIFYENGQNVTTNYTITNGKNAMSAGPITIDSGVTVTVGSGETLTIV
jgi:hypothetical protein